jgi:hypothetical protein
VRTITADIDREPKASTLEKSGSNRLRRLRRRFAEVSAIDFFCATGRMTVEALLSDLEARLVDTPAHDPTEGEPARSLESANERLEWSVTPPPWQ